MLWDPSIHYLYHIQAISHTKECCCTEYHNRGDVVAGMWLISYSSSIDSTWALLAVLRKKKRFLFASLFNHLIASAKQIVLATGPG